MEWIKIPTDNILYSEFKDSELITLIKYQALYCQLESEPTLTQLRRVLDSRQLKFIKSNAEVVQELCRNQINVVTTKRNRDKESYQQKQGVNKKPASGKTPNRELVGVTDKIRLDKIRIKENIKEINKPYVNIAETYKLMVEGYLGRSVKFNSDTWSNDLRLCEKEQGITQFENMLSWYSKHIGGDYIPICLSPKSFRDKFTEKLIPAVKRNTKSDPYAELIDMELD